jgi:serine/threonine protein kinase
MALWETRWKREGKHLGKGGQGTTELVTSVEDSSLRAALKILRNAKSEQARQRMRGEVVNLDILSQAHAKVPRVIEHNTESYKNLGIPLYVIMEYVSGETLAEFLLRTGPLDLDSAAKIALALADTMRIAHSVASSPILHRDLKPSNVIVRDPASWDIVTIDYGLSFNHEIDDVTETGERFRNEFLDLPEYRTPGANKRDTRSDVTMLSGILFWCLTGVTPATLQGPDGRPPHSRQGSEIETRLGGDSRWRDLVILFNRAFAQNVDTRFQSVDELVDRISYVIDNCSRKTCGSGLPPKT